MRRQGGRFNCVHANCRGKVPSPALRLRCKYGRAGALEQQCGEQAHRSEPDNRDNGTRYVARVEGELQRGLDEREEGRAASISIGIERHNIGPTRDHNVLVRVEREHGTTVALPYAAVPVAERVHEVTAEARERVVELNRGVDLASVGKHLGAGADPRKDRANEHLARPRRAHLDLANLDLSRRNERDSPCLHPYFISCALGRLTAVNEPREVARVSIPTPWGEFDGVAFECTSGFVYLALVKGEVAGASPVLARLHSECLTGDALGSLRCDCGLQLRLALRAIAAEGRGVLVYATGHEGRGVGLINKLLAYIEQDNGADTLDANLRLGLPVDSRRYDDAAAVLKSLGVQSLRLLTNNPAKIDALAAAGLRVERVEPARTAAHSRNLAYLRTKGTRLGHLAPFGEELDVVPPPPVDTSELLGEVRPRDCRPYVVLKYAQTIDGRIATWTGDSKWISGEDERRISHALRAACDAVLVGVGTVVQDDPQLTVRMVSGASPLRVVLDSTLRLPPDAKILDGEAATLVLTTEKSTEEDRERLRARHVGVRIVPAGPGGVDIATGLRTLRDSGVRSVLVEGGAEVITSLLELGMVDRLIIATAPKIIGRGTEAVGDLRVGFVSDGIQLTNRCVHVLDDDIVIAWDVVPAAEEAATESA